VGCERQALFQQCGKEFFSKSGCVSGSPVSNPQRYAAPTVSSAPSGVSFMKSKTLGTSPQLYYSFGYSAHRGEWPYCLSTHTLYRNLCSCL